MRVRITLKVNNRGGLVPFHHQFLVAQLLKGLIVSDGNQSYKDYEFYSFSGLKGQTSISRNGLQYTSSLVTLVISSINVDFIKYLIGLLFDQPQVRIGELTLTPHTTEEELLGHLEEETKYICISPIIALKPLFNSDEGKQYIEPDTNEFSDILFDSTISRMESLGIKTAEIKNIEKFQVVPDAGYIERLRDANKKFSRIYSVYDQDVKYEARGYTFPFTLFAAPEVQEFVINCGLGLYTFKGHGMLDVISQPKSVSPVVSKEVRELISA